MIQASMLEKVDQQTKQQHNIVNQRKREDNSEIPLIQTAP